MPTYNPTDANFLTVAQSRTNNGQKDVRVILDIAANTFYTLDDDGNFNLINSGSTTSLGYTEYVAYVIQSGVNNPTATVVKNDLIGPVTFNRTGVGTYEIICTGGFDPYQNVVPYFNVQSASITPNTPHILIYWNDINTLGVETYDDDNILADAIFTGNLVIKLYD